MTEQKQRFSYTAPKHLIEEAQKETGGEEDQFRKQKLEKLEDKFTYKKKARLLSPDRRDIYSDAQNEQQENTSRTYAEIMIQNRLEIERSEIENKIKKQKMEQGFKKEDRKKPEQVEKVEKQPKSGTDGGLSTTAPKSEWESDSVKQKKSMTVPSKWDTPGRDEKSTPLPAGQQQQVSKKSRWDQTSQQEATPSRLAGVFGETPTPGHLGTETPLRYGETPTPSRQYSRARWDDKTPLVGATPGGGFGMMTPTTPGIMQTPSTPSQMNSMNPDKIQQFRWEKELEERNRYLTDDELDSILPGIKDGYEVLQYQRI